MKIVLIHGALDDPSSNWFPWLGEKLEECSLEVLIPRFPTPDGQNLNTWLEIFYKLELKEEIILVGHSTGSAFILSLLERINVPVKAAYLVAGFINPLNSVNEVCEGINLNALVKTFINKTFDWKGIQSNCANINVIHSKNDPYTPLSDIEYLSSQIGANFICFDDAESVEYLLKFK